jgi:hypothetical protein
MSVSSYRPGDESGPHRTSSGAARSAVPTREDAIVKRRKPKSEPPPESKPSAEALYERSAGNRRIMFLELVAWAIVQIEQQPPEALSRFTGELEMSRRREWHEMPWPGAAKDEQRFERHVLDLARTFAGSGEYALRRWYRALC